MILTLLLLIASLVILMLGAELLVRGASALAQRMGVSSFFVGLTIVGFGTSTPELATGVTAALQGLSDINIGNVVGSNIFNIALILGVTALICPIPVKAHLVRSETLIVIAVSTLPYFAILSGGVIERWLAVLLVGALVVYVWRGFRIGRNDQPQLEQELVREVQQVIAAPLPGTRARSEALNIAFIIVGLALLTGGSKLLVDSSIEIARSLGVSELVIALTIVAAGTSAPELFTSLVAALRKQSDISVGNILGSNIFNILGILGISSLIRPQHVSAQVFWLDAPVMMLASIACLPIMLSSHRISRTEGLALIAGYLVYVMVLFTLAPRWFA